MTIEEIAAECAEHSDIGSDFAEYVKVFYAAHEHQPGGLSLEIGTRAGGSALAILRVMQSLYDDPPMLFTVDPYGSKPYPKGIDDKTELEYGSDFYLKSKALLAPFANHAHFLMTGEEFCQRVLGTPYWRNGVEHRVTDFSLVFLDGDHSALTVLLTLKLLAGHLRGGALVVIDNANWDGDIVKPMLGGPFNLLSYNGRACLLVRI